MRTKVHFFTSQPIVYCLLLVAYVVAVVVTVAVVAAAADVEVIFMTPRVLE